MNDTAAQAEAPAWELLQIYLAITVGSKTAHDVLDLARQVAAEERETTCRAVEATVELHSERDVMKTPLGKTLNEQQAIDVSSAIRHAVKWAALVARGRAPNPIQ